MLYFLHGDTSPLQIKYEELVEKIKNEFPKIPEIFFDASQKEEEQFFQIVSTNSMFSPKELIILKRAEEIKNLESFFKSLKLFSLAQKEIIIVYEEFLSDYGKIKNEVPKKAMKAIEEIAKVICFRKENEKKAGIFFVQKELNISEYEAEKFIEIVGNDFFKIKNEAEKVKNFLDGELFNLTKVMPILSINKEYNHKQLIEEFLYQKKVTPLLEFLQNEKEYMGFLYIISEELILNLKIALLAKEDIISKNTSYKKFNDSIFENVKKYFKRDNGYFHPYQIFLKFKNIGDFQVEFLEEKLQKILEIEFNIKSGMIDDEIAIETFIINFFQNKKD
ncbi:DNA polymerase III subunit delta [uncultured Fusobacterium sp.]|uniref:DNA polymerase III subunit delta n=1 Tax=uncultured Fusobacterium sp. TaxID=159267 RepID=UPI00265DB618|nr:hypothetical protein [uncultured Fusobacterium sp.]